jgi:hypothetical protein
MSVGGLAKAAREQGDFDQWLRNNLAPGQYDSYWKNVGNDPFFGSQINRETIKGATQQEASDGVANFWRETFKLDQSALPALQAISQEYVNGCWGIRNEYSRLYGTSMPRSAAIEMTAKILDLQAAAEARIGQALPLTADQAKRVQQTSMTVMDFGN